ncbi:MAG: PD40 domain-containing protein [Bacteroidales bacterium]|nr:PD40 domain-containing protein [Bacteroidales bacterium]
MKSFLSISALIILILAAVGCSGTGEQSDIEYNFPELSGPYLGQPMPDSIPGLFARGVVSTGIFTRDVAIAPDGTEIYFCVAIGNYTYSTILYSKEMDGKWLPPEIVPFSGGPGVMDLEPVLTADGSRLYFLSNRPDGDEPMGDQDIWFVDRTTDGWGTPQNLGEPVNTDGGEFFPSLTKDGTLYFTRNEKGSQLNQLFRSRWENGAFQEPELLPEQVNCGTNRFNAFVSPDESYMIVPAAGMEDAYDGVDYYIVFRDMNDQWSEPINMGEKVNLDNARGWSPYVSPDGKVFFFMATRTSEIEPEDWNYKNLKALNNSPGNGNADIYWMDAGFIRILKEKALGDLKKGP